MFRLRSWASSMMIALSRHGRWRNPLAGAVIPTGGPTIAGVGAVVLAYVALAFAATSWLVPAAAQSQPLEPGTDAWHRAQSADGFARCAASVLMALMLLQARRAPPRDAHRPGVLRAVAMSVLALLALLPVATAQLELGELIWKWSHPGATPPVHIVLRALGHSDWGVGGIVQLSVEAVVLAPLSEELFFRGMLLQALCYHGWRAWPAVLLSSVAFGLVHGQPQDVLPLVTMGLVLGYVRLRCGALWPCILMHMLFNARTIAVALLAPELDPSV